MRSYGFTPVKEESTLVNYESATCFVNVYHGRASYEIGVEVGRLDRPDKYGLSYIVGEAGKDALEAEGFGRSTMFQVSSHDGVQEFVPKVARLLHKYGDSFLRGDPTFYDRLEKINQQRSLEFTKRQTLERKRKAAESAWAQKDFSRVVELYNSMIEDLRKIEADKLKYAKKHMSQTTSGDLPR